MDNKNVYNKIVNWFEAKEWKYSWDEKRNTFSWGIWLGNDTEALHFILQLDTDYYIVYGFAPNFTVAPEFLNPTLQLLNKINSKMIFGAFEIAENSAKAKSEVRLKLYVDCLKQAPSSEIIERSVFLPAQVLMQYRKEIANVATGIKNIEEVSI